MATTKAAPLRDIVNTSDRVSVEKESCLNTLAMPIHIWTVRVDGITVAEFREERYAEMFVSALIAEHSRL